MSHEWMSGPVKFLLSAPVQLAFFSLYSKLHDSCEAVIHFTLY